MVSVLWELMIEWETVEYDCNQTRQVLFGSLFEGQQGCRRTVCAGWGSLEHGFTEERASERRRAVAGVCQQLRWGNHSGSQYGRATMGALPWCLGKTTRGQIWSNRGGSPAVSSDEEAKAPL